MQCIACKVDIYCMFTEQMDVYNIDLEIYSEIEMTKII